MRVAPGEPRSSIEDTPEGLQVTIPAPRNIFVLLFLGFWLIGWGFGETFAIRALLGGKAPLSASLFLLVWLGGWTIGGAFAGFTWLWMLVGSERIVLRPDALAIKREVLGLGRTREYALADIQRLRTEAPAALGMSRAVAAGPAARSFGSIAFDHGAKTVRFGGSLDEAEARMIVDTLCDRYPFPRATSEN